LSTKNAIEWNNEGLELYQAKKYDQAIASFLKAIELDNTNPIFYKNLGDAYYDQGDTKKGLDYYKTALKMDEKNVAFLLDYAVILHQDHQDRLALTQLNKAIEIDSQNSEVLYQLIVVYYSLNEYQSAISFAHRLLKSDATNQDVLLILIRSYFQQKEYPLVEQTLERVLSIKPSNARALFLGSQYYQEIKNSVKACEYLIRAYEADLENPAIVESLYESYENAFLFGRLYPLVQKFRDSHFIFDSYLGKRTSPPITMLDYYLLGINFREALYADTQDLAYQLDAEKAQKLIESIENFIFRMNQEAQTDPEQDNSKLLQALVLFTERKYHEAFEIIGKMFGQMSSELYYFLLAITWLLKGDYDPARKSWNIFIKNDKADASILLFYCYTLYKLEQNDLAEDFLKKAHEVKLEWQLYFPILIYFENPSIEEDLFGIAIQKIFRYLQQIKAVDE
jgi:tetratricopeptide (TPR) repeat protein